MEKDLRPLIEEKFNQITGHTFQKEIFRKLINGNRLHTTYLFYGPSGVGKKLFAVKIAEILLSSTSRKKKANK